MSTRIQGKNKATTEEFRRLSDLMADLIFNQGNLTPKDTVPLFIYCLGRSMAALGLAENITDEFMVETLEKAKQVLLQKGILVRVI